MNSHLTQSNLLINHLQEKIAQQGKHVDFSHLRWMIDHLPVTVDHPLYAYYAQLATKLLDDLESGPLVNRPVLLEFIRDIYNTLYVTASSSQAAILQALQSRMPATYDVKYQSYERFIESDRFFVVFSEDGKRRMYNALKEHLDHTELNNPQYIGPAYASLTYAEIKEAYPVIESLFQEISLPLSFGSNGPFALWSDMSLHLPSETVYQGGDPEILIWYAMVIGSGGAKEGALSKIASENIPWFINLLVRNFSVV